MNRQDLSNAAPGFKVAKKIINMPKKRKTKIPKFPLYFEDFSFINLLIFNVFVVGLNELKIKKKIFSLLSYDEKQLFTKRDKKTPKNDFFTPLYYPAILGLVPYGLSRRE